MAFNWRREPSNPYLPADGSMAQMAANSMAGYQPLTAMTPHGNGMNGYFSNDAVANQSQGFSVPNQQHGGMGQPELDGYGASLQAASEAAAKAQAREQQIADIQSQIKTLETRIAENQAKLKNWNDDNVANKVAALEARKFFSQDPTSIWRWKAGMDAQKAQRAEDLERIEKEKKLSEEKNLKINRNKIDNILQSTMPTQNMTRDKMDMAVKQLNDAEELAKNYGDIDALKKINERKNDLGIYVPVDDEANIIESDFVKNMEMVGKKGGMDKKQFAKYVQSVLDDPNNKHIWHYSPELQRKLYAAIGKNTGAKPTNYAGY